MTNKKKQKMQNVIWLAAAGKWVLVCSGFETFETIAASYLPFSESSFESCASAPNTAASFTWLVTVEYEGYYSASPKAMKGEEQMKT